MALNSPSWHTASRKCSICGYWNISLVKQFSWVSLKTEQHLVRTLSWNYVSFILLSNRCNETFRDSDASRLMSWPSTGRSQTLPITIHHRGVHKHTFCDQSQFSCSCWIWLFGRTCNCFRSCTEPLRYPWEFQRDPVQQPKFLSLRVPSFGYHLIAPPPVI